MIWLLWILAVLVGLVVLIVVIGMLLPKNHTATVSQRIGASAEAVFATITNWNEFPAWRSGLKSVAPRDDGGWIETSSHGVIPFVVIESVNPSRLVTRIADPKLPFGGTWTWVLTPDAAGCVVTITEDGEVFNPVFRFVSRFVLGYEGTMKTVLRDLQRKFEASDPSRLHPGPAATVSS